VAVTDDEHVEHVEQEEGRHLRPAEKARLVERLRAGDSMVDLSREFGVPVRVVRQWARQERRRVGVGTNGREQLDDLPAAYAELEIDDQQAEPPPARVPVVGWLREEVEPEPYVSAGRSARTHWRLVGAITLLTVILGLVVGLARKPTYTAEARLVVGKTIQLSNLAATPGLALASQQLASDYSRLVSTRSVVNDAAKRLGRAPGNLGGSVSASPIPQSPVIRLEGHAKVDGDAVAIADAGAAALVHAVNVLNEKQLQSAQVLLDQYRQADDVLLRDQQTLRTLQDRLTREGTDAPQSLRDQVLAAQTAVDADQLNLNALGNDYEGAISPGQLNEQVVQRVGAASATGNDRQEFLQITLLVGLVAGIVIGVAVAALIDARATHRKSSLRDADAPA
jgi:transposase-like protein